MSILEGSIAFGRKQAEALMISTVVITRVVGSPVQNDDGSLTPNIVTVYSGKCGLRYPFVRPEAVLVEGEQLSKIRGVLSLPVSTSSGVAVDDEALVTLGNQDPGTVLRVRVMAPFTETRMTARRFPVEAVS